MIQLNTTVIKMLNWIKKILNPTLNKKLVEKRVVNDYDFNKLRKEKQDKLDKILDKISEKGLKSLTENELKNLNKK
jgi:hypothetical protein